MLCKKCIQICFREVPIATEINVNIEKIICISIWLTVKTNVCIKQKLVNEDCHMPITEDNVPRGKC